MPTEGAKRLSLVDARKACQQRRERYYEQRPINLALQQKDQQKIKDPAIRYLSQVD